MNSSMDAMSAEAELLAQSAPNSSLEFHPSMIDRGQDLEMIVNVTKEYPFEYAKVMFGYIMPFVLVLTLVTNTLVIMVLYQRHMRTPTNIVLFTMAIVDLMTLVSPSPWYFYIYTLGYHDKFLYPPVACYLYYYMTDVIPVFFHTSSIWLALLLAGQRYIYVCHPSVASVWCTVPRVRKWIVGILALAFLHQIPKFFDNKFEPVTIAFNQSQYPACRNGISDWVFSINVGAYYITYFTFRIVLVFVIPCVALITLNCLLFGALRRAESKRSELLKTKFKFVGGNRSSVAGYEPPLSSYAGNSVIKNEPPTTSRPSSSLHWPNRRKISSPLVRLSRNTTDAEETEQEQRDTFGRGLSNSATATTGVAVEQQRVQRSPQFGCDSRCDTHSRPTTRTTSPHDPISDKIVGDRRRLEGRSDSRESEATGDQRDTSRRSSMKRGSCPGSRCAMREQGKQQSKESNESYSVVSNQSVARDENQSKSKISIDDQSNGRDDDYTCPGCTFCDQQQMEDLRCRRCLASSEKDAINSTHHHHHQPVSQCSSMIGGVTNTTTNDEVSSCGNTHNISSSMYVVHDGTLDGIESASIREDEEVLLDGERESTSLHHNNTGGQNDKRSRRNRKSVSADGGTRGDMDLTKSNSIDSRLICGCPISPDRKTPYRCPRSSSGRQNGCRECCLAKKYRRPASKMRGATNEQLARSGPAMQKCIASCSSSEPCIKCNHNTQDGKSKSGRESGQAAGDKKKTISQSSPDYYGDRCAIEGNGYANRQRSNVDIYLDGNAAATTTTTTTLYSIQANSVGSLLQAQNHHSSRHKSIGTPQLTTGQETQAKSPSFVSTMGRGSRAALVGNSGFANPPTLVVTSGNYPVASLRTMDSNRTTLMLIVVVSVFLIVEVPVAIVTIAHVILNSFDAFKEVELGAHLSYIKLFTNFLIMMSYSVNFTIYCSMSKKFRDTFRDLFKQTKRKRAACLSYQQNQHSHYITSNNNNNNNTTTNINNNNSITNVANNNNSNTNVNNNNSHGAHPNLLQSYETCQSSNPNTASNDLVAGTSLTGEQSDQTTATTRYTPYRTINESQQQQECEL